MDRQVADNRSKQNDLKASNMQSEIDSIKHYPFGTRTDPNSYLNHNNTSANSYQIRNNPSGHPIDYRSANNVEREFKYNKNNIVEKPNSLNSDFPSYDPIKHRYGHKNLYTYDPVS